MIERDSNNNKFLKVIYNLYDAKHGYFQDNKTEFARKSKWKFWGKPAPVTVNKTLEAALEAVNEFRDKLTKEVPDFTTMWDFCEFVRVMEKVFFFENVPNNDIYVECDIGKSGNGSRKFRIYITDDTNVSIIGEIRFILEKDVFGSDVITINVIRNYGLKMENKYIVADANIKYEDSSDIYLINEINDKLQLWMSFMFSQAVSQILKEGGFIYGYRIPKARTTGGDSHS